MDRMPPRSSVPQLPGGPDAGQPVPRTPVDGLDLRAFAAISAALATRDEPRAAVLARAGLTELRWTSIETTWLLRVATALLQQDLSLSRDHDEAFAAAQAEIAARR